MLVVVRRRVKPVPGTGVICREAGEAVSVELLAEGAFLIAGFVDAATLEFGDYQVDKRGEIRGADEVFDIETVHALPRFFGSWGGFVPDTRNSDRESALRVRRFPGNGVY